MFAIRRVLSLMFFAAGCGLAAAAAVQAPTLQKQVITKAKGPQVTNYVMRLSDAYIVYEPSSDVFQIAAQGGVLSYGDGWDRVRVKPYLYHLRHRSWSNHFWKVNTSRKELYLVWGGAFGHIGSGPGPAREVEGDRVALTVEVVGGAGESVPDRFLIRFPGAELHFVPATRDLSLSAMGMTLSPCDDWEACRLKDYLFHIRLKTWKGFHWKVNTSRKQAWRTTDGEFCQLGGEDRVLDLTMVSFDRPFSMARLRVAPSAAERARLKVIVGMIESGRPLAEINKSGADFVRDHPDLDPAAAIKVISAEIKGLEAAMEAARNERQMAATAFENFDQKANQLFNILSSLMKTMSEMRAGTVRNML